MKQLLLLKTNSIFFFFFLTLALFGQNRLIIPDSISDKNKKAEFIITQFNNYKGNPSDKLKFLEPLKQLTLTDKNLLWETLYLNLSADAEANFQDKSNTKSNELYEKSIKISKSHPELNFWALTNYAYYNYHYRRFSTAMPLFIDATRLVNDCNPEKMIAQSESFKKIGYFMTTLGDTKESIKYLGLAEKYAPVKSSELASILDNQGYNYMTINNLGMAEKYFIKARQISKEIKDYVRLGKVIGNLALLNDKKGNTDKAILLMQEDLHYSRMYEADQNTMYALTCLSRFYIKKGALKEAKETLNEAETFAISKDYFKKNEFDILNIKLQIAKLEKNDATELSLRRKIEQITNALALSDGEEAVRKVNLLAQKEKYVNSINIAQAQYEKENLLRKAIASIAFLLILLIIFIVINNKRKLKEKQSSYDNKLLKLYLDKIKSEEDLRTTDHNLASYKVYLQEKNIQIEKLQKNIEAIRQNGPLEIQKVKMEALLQSHLMTDEHWSSFKKSFEQEYPVFYNMLLAEFKDLTESNFRLIILMKLGLSNYEIASIQYITIDAVKKAKQRLKKKLGEKSDFLFENYA